MANPRGNGASDVGAGCERDSERPDKTETCRHGPGTGSCPPRLRKRGRHLVRQTLFKRLSHLRIGCGVVIHFLNSFCSLFSLWSCSVLRLLRVHQCPQWETSPLRLFLRLLFTPSSLSPGGLLEPACILELVWLCSHCPYCPANR